MGYGEFLAALNDPIGWSRKGNLRSRKRSLRQRRACWRPAAASAPAERSSSTTRASASPSRLHGGLCAALPRQRGSCSCPPQPDSLRHSAITAALKAGVPFRDVQDFAGHAAPRTTRSSNGNGFCLAGCGDRPPDQAVERWTATRSSSSSSIRMMAGWVAAVSRTRTEMLRRGVGLTMGTATVESGSAPWPRRGITVIPMPSATNLMAVG